MKNLLIKIVAGMVLLVVAFFSGEYKANQHISAQQQTCQTQLDQQKYPNSYTQAQKDGVTKAIQAGDTSHKEDGRTVRPRR